MNIWIRAFASITGLALVLSCGPGATTPAGSDDPLAPLQGTWQHLGFPQEEELTINSTLYVGTTYDVWLEVQGNQFRSIYTQNGTDPSGDGSPVIMGSVARSGTVDWQDGVITFRATRILDRVFQLATLTDLAAQPLLDVSETNVFNALIVDGQLMGGDIGPVEVYRAQGAHSGIGGTWTHRNLWHDQAQWDELFETWQFDPSAGTGQLLDNHRDAPDHQNSSGGFQFTFTVEGDQVKTHYIPPPGSTGTNSGSDQSSTFRLVGEWLLLRDEVHPERPLEGLSRL